MDKKAFAWAFVAFGFAYVISMMNMFADVDGTVSVLGGFTGMFIIFATFFSLGYLFVRYYHA